MVLEVKNPSASAGSTRHKFDPWVKKIPWSRKWHPAPVSCLGDLMDRGAWQPTVHRAAESQTWLSKWASKKGWMRLRDPGAKGRLCNAEGNGNPLQYSCLGSHRNRGARWAAVYGVAQSWTRLKWLSSSNRLCNDLSLFILSLYHKELISKEKLMKELLF